ncbi:hypothetical protein DW766_13780 [Butyricicoccus sp. AM29-23AC]|nr:hypothetical protein DW766_13780 [Butyricicoccus sp. AM29-23AC]
MQYVCSDIHGRYDKWCALLAALDLKPTDTLYVLGDVIDRGPDGIKVLQDMAQRLNVIPILGNHELDAALCIPKLLQEVTDESIAALSGKDFAALSEWLQNGGGPTAGTSAELAGRAGGIAGLSAGYGSLRGGGSRRTQFCSDTRWLGSF